MWIAKGIFLGVAMFAVGIIVYMIFIYRSILARSGPVNGAVGIDVTVIQNLTTQNPYFWAAFAACLVLGLSIVRSWPNNVPVS